MSEEAITLNIIILGLENAGKTTLARTIVGKEFIETQTTIGMNIEIVDFKGYRFQIIDIGGQETFRETLWPHYTTLAKGVIFVFDMFDKQKANESKKWFNYITTWISEKATLIFLANKIDLKESNDQFLSIEEIIKQFELDKISRFPMRTFRIFEVSAKTGNNVEESIRWFLEKIAEGIKEETRISFVVICNEENKVVYSNMPEDDEAERIQKVVTKKLVMMREKNTKESQFKMDNYRIMAKVEKSYSITIGTIYDISEQNLQIALESISDLIKKEYSPPEDHKDHLDGVINLTLIRRLEKSS